MPSSIISILGLAFVVFASSNGFTISSTQPLGFSGKSAVFSTFAPETSKPGNLLMASFLNQPIAGYPKVPPANAYESGGHEDDLLPPFEEGIRNSFGFKSQSFRRSIENTKVDPKTGYPLTAHPSWKDAGGNEENLELPLEDFEKAVDQEAVDPKTGYPLVAQASWKDAGGNGEILELPFEESEKPIEQEAVDPKTGYPLVAKPSWKDAGGDGDILQLPAEDTEESIQGKVDPKTGYPLLAKPEWSYAGGNEEILELPLEDFIDNNQVPTDPKTGYPLIAQSSWKDAGGNGDILELPEVEKSNQEEVDPKTGYPLIAQPGWKDAGGNEENLELPFEESTEGFSPELDVRFREEIDEEELTKLRPPPVESQFPIFSANSLPTPNTFSRSFQQSTSFPTSFSSIQRRSSSGNQPQAFGIFRGENRPIESSYTYTGPENVVVTVTRFLSTDQPKNQNFQTNSPTSEKNPIQRAVSQNGFKPNGPFQSDKFTRQTPWNEHNFQRSVTSQNLQSKGNGKIFESTPPHSQTTLFQSNYSNLSSRQAEIN